MFRASANVRLDDGASTRFWMDSWLPDDPISLFALSLFQAVGKRRQNCTVKQALAHRSWVRDMSGAPSELVLCDYVLLWEKLERVHLQPMVSDRFVWKWIGDGNYSASLAYRSFFIGRTLLVGAQHLWHAHAPPKVKFFFGSASMVAYGLPRDGSAMDYNKMRRAHCALMMTKRRITSCVRACSRGKFGTGSFMPSAGSP